MAATALSFTECKPNVPNSNFTLFCVWWFKNKRIHQSILFDLLYKTQRTENRAWDSCNDREIINLDKPKRSPQFPGNHGKRMILTFAVWPHGKYPPTPKIWKLAWPEPRNQKCWSTLRQGWLHVSPGNTMLSHLRVSFHLWGIFFMFHMCLCGIFLCVHTILYQREIPSLAPEAWGPVFVVIWNSFVSLK